ncbi:MAG: FtsX-like permease family protein [Candidatus Eisenbacteria bacterium]|nr:FtsX-like permease family protein [Candidatus Eisenbacteria bacterium]
MRYEFWIAGRYLRSKKRTGFVSLITWISIGGVALGVVALVVVLSMVNGFEEEVRSRIVGTNAHLILLSYGESGMTDHQRVRDDVVSIPGVIGSAPFVYGKALLSAGGQSDGVIVKGVSLAAERNVTTVADHIEPPLADFPIRPTDPDSARNWLPGLVLGRHIAETMRVGVGDIILVASPFEGRATPLGVIPRVRKFRLLGVFNSGLYEYDSSLAYVSLEEAQRFYDLGKAVTGIELKIEDMYAAASYEEKVLERLGGYPYRINTWIELNQNLFAWMKWEKLGMAILLFTIVIVAAFNIVSAQIMLVLEKRREIGILKSMGATRAEIMLIFMAEGLVIGGAGTLAGSVLGYALAFFLDRYHLISLPGDIYFLETLPMKIHWPDGVAITLLTLALCFLATIYPSWKAARLDPVEAIRND